MSYSNYSSYNSRNNSSKASPKQEVQRKALIIDAEPNHIGIDQATTQRSSRLREILNSSYNYDIYQLSNFPTSYSSNVVAPTLERVLVGLKWLACNNNPGDYLCLYLAGESFMIPRESHPDLTRNEKALLLSDSLITFVAIWSTLAQLTPGVQLNIFTEITYDGAELQETMRFPVNMRRGSDIGISAAPWDGVSTKVYHELIRYYWKPSPQVYFFSRGEYPIVNTLTNTLCALLSENAHKEYNMGDFIAQMTKGMKDVTNDICADEYTAFHFDTRPRQHVSAFIDKMHLGVHRMFSPFQPLSCSAVRNGVKNMTSNYMSIDIIPWTQSCGNKRETKRKVWDPISGVMPKSTKYTPVRDMIIRNRKDFEEEDESDVETAKVSETVEATPESEAEKERARLRAEFSHGFGLYVSPKEKARLEELARNNGAKEDSSPVPESMDTAPTVLSAAVKEPVITASQPIIVPSACVLKPEGETVASLSRPVLPMEISKRTYENNGAALVGKKGALIDQNTIVSPAEKKEGRKEVNGTVNKDEEKFDETVKKIEENQNAAGEAIKRLEEFHCLTAMKGESQEKAMASIQDSIAELREILVYQRQQLESVTKQRNSDMIANFRIQSQLEMEVHSLRNQLEKLKEASVCVCSQSSPASIKSSHSQDAPSFEQALKNSPQRKVPENVQLSSTVLKPKESPPAPSLGHKVDPDSPMNCTPHIQQVMQLNLLPINAGDASLFTNHASNSLHVIPFSNASSTPILALVSISLSPVTLPLNSLSAESLTINAAPASFLGAFSPALPLTTPSMLEEVPSITQNKAFQEKALALLAASNLPLAPSNPLKIEASQKAQSAPLPTDKQTTLSGSSNSLNVILDDIPLPRTRRVNKGTLSRSKSDNTFLSTNVTPTLLPPNSKSRDLVGIQSPPAVLLQGENGPAKEYSKMLGGPTALNSVYASPDQNSIAFVSRSTSDSSHPSSMLGVSSASLKTAESISDPVHCLTSVNGDCHNKVCASGSILLKKDKVNKKMVENTRSGERKQSKGSFSKFFSRVFS